MGGRERRVGAPGQQVLEKRETAVAEADKKNDDLDEKTNHGTKEPK
jgi:hypothetical protein